MTSPLWRPAYIGLGSNLDEPQEQIRRGVNHLEELPQSVVVLRSGLYRSAPLGPHDQPDFVNGVIAIMTELSPQELLSFLQAIEMKHGRDRRVERWGPRTIDLDLLAYSAMRLSSDDLTLPHPGIAKRNFVLLPWCEITPHYRVPGLATIAQLARLVDINNPQIERLN